MDFSLLPFIAYPFAYINVQCCWSPPSLPPLAGRLQMGAALLKLVVAAAVSAAAARTRWEELT